MHWQCYVIKHKKTIRKQEEQTCQKAKKEIAIFLVQLLAVLLILRNSFPPQQNALKVIPQFSQVIYFL